MEIRRFLWTGVCILVAASWKGEMCVRKVFCALAALGVAALLGTRAAAVEEFGSVRLDIVIEDLAVTRGAVTLYQVGYPVQEGYRIGEAFGGGIVQHADAHSPHLAQWLAESAGEGGVTRLLDADGDVVFSGLEDGLYLLVQTEGMDGFYPVTPQLVTIPQEEKWDVELELIPLPIVVENPRTGDAFSPVWGMLGVMGSGFGLALCARKRKKRG